jgi:hypothetical protein
MMVTHRHFVSSKVMNAWSYTYAPAYSFIAWSLIMETRTRKIASRSTALGSLFGRCLVRISAQNTVYPDWDISRVSSLPPSKLFNNCNYEGSSTGRIAIFLHSVHTGSGAHRTSYSVGSEGLFSRGVQRPEREADHSLPFSAEFKNVWAIPPFLRMPSWRPA